MDNKAVKERLKQIVVMAQGKGDFGLWNALTALQRESLKSLARDTLEYIKELEKENNNENIKTRNSK